MFRLTIDEKNELVQICHRFETMKHSTSMPYAFTEHGVAMLSGVLNSERAIKINIVIIKVFVKLREIISTHRELAQKINELEHKIEGHDEHIRTIFEAIRRLMEPPPEPPKRRIGFHP